MTAACALSLLFLLPQDDTAACTVVNAATAARSALVTVALPFTKGELSVGTWQKIVCIDFDDRPRSRRLVVQLLGV